MTSDRGGYDAAGAGDFTAASTGMESLDRIWGDWRDADGKEHEGIGCVVYRQASIRLRRDGVPSANLDANDVCQMTYLKMRELWSDGTVANPEGLASTIAIRLIHDERKKLRPLRGGTGQAAASPGETSADPEIPSPGYRYVPIDAVLAEALSGTASSVEEQVADQEAMRWIEKTVRRQLSPQESRVFWLRFWEHSRQEIAAGYGIQSNSVSQYIARARRKLKGPFDRAWKVPGIILLWLLRRFPGTRQRATAYGQQALQPEPGPASRPGKRGHHVGHRVRELTVGPAASAFGAALLCGMTLLASSDSPGLVPTANPSPATAPQAGASAPASAATTAASQFPSPPGQSQSPLGIPRPTRRQHRG